MRPPAIVAWCIGLAAALLGSPEGWANGQVVAGAAQETFTLPAGVPLAGYGRRKGEPSTGVHDPAGVRALVVRDADTTVAFVSCDLLVIDEHLDDAVRRRLIADGLPEPFTLVLAATHTHSGPGAYGTRFLEKISMGHFNPAVFEELVARISQAVARAAAQTVPVRLAYAEAPTEGLVANRMEPGGLVDARVVVCAFYPKAGDTPMAVLVNFAAHPTTLGAWNRQVSADYPGVVMQELGHRFPSAVCFFFAGAVGDQAPVKSGDGFERSDRIGRPLAEAAAAALAGSRPEVPRDVAAAQTRMPLAPAQLRLTSWLTLPSLLGNRLVDDDATITVVRIGPVVWFGVPCDLSAELGERLKAAARGRSLSPVVVGFADDYIGYCVSERLYRSRQYETSMAFNGPLTGTQLVEQAIRLMEPLAN